MKCRLIVTALALVSAIPASAQDDVSLQTAEQRLRGCLVVGSTTTPYPGLREAVLSVRSFCGSRIKLVRQLRVEAATAGLEGESYKRVEDQTVRELNDEIAFAISNFTGLTL